MHVGVPAHMCISVYAHMQLMSYSWGRYFAPFPFSSEMKPRALCMLGTPHWSHSWNKSKQSSSRVGTC